MSSPALSAPTATKPGALPARTRAEDDAVKALAVAIHRELRETLSPEDVVRIASELLSRVAEELRERREGRPALGAKGGASV